MLHVVLLAILALASGCAHKPANYRLLPLDRGHVVLPPEVIRPDLANRTFVANLTPSAGPCRIEDEAVRLQPRGKRIRVTVNRDALLKREPGWLAAWSVRAESQGCVATGSGQKLASLIVESLPLDSAAAYRLLHANTIRSGYVELGPDNRLEVRSPIMRDGISTERAEDPRIAKVTGTANQLNVDLVGTPSIIGFETAWYAIEPNAERMGYRLVPGAADRNIQGAVEHYPAPAMNYFQFAPQAAFFRLFYKGDDNDVRAIVISGTTREDLDRRTKAVAANIETCIQATGMCLMLPRRVGVNPFMIVSVNGHDVRVPLQSTVAAAIRASGTPNPDSVLPQLRLTRLFRDRPTPVEFDRNSREILTLYLLGGEQISWR